MIIYIVLEMIDDRPSLNLAFTNEEKANAHADTLTEQGSQDVEVVPVNLKQ